MVASLAADRTGEARQDRLAAAFVMEQDVGHAVQAIHLRRELSYMNDLEWSYIPVTFHAPHGLVERISLLSPELRASLRARFEVRAGLAGQRPQVLFWNTHKPSVLHQDLLARTPSVISLDVTPLQYDELGKAYGHSPDRAGVIASFKHAINRRVFRLAHKLLPATTWAARSLIDSYGVLPEKIEVLPPGTDLERFQPADRFTSRSGERLRVLFVGGDFLRKGGDVVLDWFRTADPKLVELHVVTREVLEPRQGLFVHALSFDDPDLPGLYQQADVFVLPTRAECFGLVLTEAMASGLPCVTCPVGGVAEVVLEGVTGLMVRPDDPTSFGRAMERLLADASLRWRMGTAGRKRAEERFDAKKNVRRIVEVLRETAEVAGRSRAKLRP
jgi:glycosyltransferase involved in cell wall biosynthesis